MNELRIRTDEANLQDTIDGFVDLVEDVPFGNSDWQNRQAIVNSELTPERAYRHAALRIMSRLQALNEAYYGLRKDELEVAKLYRGLDAERDPIERELIELEIAKRRSARSYQQKLVKDAVREVESLAPVVLAMGKLSKDQFEAGEAGHFKRKYEDLLAGKPDAAIGLEAMGFDLRTGRRPEDFVSLFERISRLGVTG